MLSLIRYVFFLLPLVSTAQSSLPSCPEGNSSWHQCFGRYKSTIDGATYVGEWASNLRNGSGIEYSSSGRKIKSGLWKDGKLVSQFELDQRYYPLQAGSQFTDPSAPLHNANQGVGLPTCDEQFGNWSNCFGRYVSSVNSTVYVGEWQSNTRHGKGVEYSQSGSLLRSGIWRDNKFVGEMLLDLRIYAFNFRAENIHAYSNIKNPDTERLERDRIAEELKIARKRQQELEERLAQETRERERLSTLSMQLQKPEILINRNDRRVALVIGNSNYTSRPLRNPINDANDVSSALKASGFQVIDLRDATLQQMRVGVRLFGDRLLSNDVGLVYYSGHGVEVKGRNYFMPVNADVQREDEIADQGLDVSVVLEKMNTAGKGVNILIVDACRDDPFGRSFRSTSRGLAQLDAPRGTIIAYATSPGKVASDGDPRERNSPYTKHLLRAMQQPNKPIEQVFKEVRRAVQSETRDQQTPWENTSLSGDFYFKIQK